MREKKAVRNKTNINKDETSKVEIIDLDRNCEFSLRQIPISKARVEQIIDELESWYDRNPTAKYVHEFYYAMGISDDTYLRLRKKHPRLQQLHEITMRRLGHKLYANAVDCKANWNAVKFMIHHYAPEFKEAREYEAQLSKKDDVTDRGPQFIVIDQFPSSDLVPVKKGK